jgi:hypothetical protein
MGLQIGLNCVFLGALVAFPLLLAVFAAEVLLDSGQVAEGSRRVVVHAGALRTYVHLLPHLIFVCSLLQLPRKVVTASMQLQVLVSLETFLANFAYETVLCHQRLGRQSYHFRIWICFLLYTNHFINNN